MIKSLNKAYLKAGAAASAAVLANAPGSAMASGQSLTQLSTNMTDEAASVPQLISWVAYLCGAGLGMAGIFKLRQHVDSPAQTPMKDGLIRLGASGALLALPVIMSAMTDFVGGGATATNNLPTLGPGNN